MKESMTKAQKLTLSAMVIALYAVVMYLTQSFVFGAYQIRIATALYALAYLFPFLVFPLGLANSVSNLIGGLGILDIVGGFFVGLLTSFLVAGIRKLGWNRFLVAVPIILVPGLGVATWLSYLLHFPYPLMALNLCVGQIVPGICGALLVGALEKILGSRNL